MAIGLTPARGNWESRWFETSSTATFPKGALVNFDAGYHLKEYLSTDSQVVGIAASYSTQSTSMRGVQMVQVYLPTPNCTAECDVTTGLANSDMSIGKHVCAEKRGNYMSFASSVIGHSSLLSAVFTVVGPIDAKRSRIEVAFNMQDVAFYSNSTATYAS